MTRKTILLGSAAMAMSMIVTDVMAQSDEISIDEIIVRARKKDEKLQEVPLAINAFSAGKIEQQSISSVDELTKLATGVSFDSDFGRQADRPVIRGQSTILGASGVAYFIDGVYYTGDLQDFNMEDAQSIEFIKGPQSALYGRNTYSGAISIHTKAPKQKSTATVKLEAAGFGQYSGSFSLSGPLTDSLAMSVSGRLYQRDGIGGKLWTNKYDGRKMGDQKSASASWAAYYEPSENVDIKARVMWSRMDDGQPPLANTGYKMNNCYNDNSFNRPTITSPTTFAPVAGGPGSVYIGAGRYICGEVPAVQINTDDKRAIGQKAEVDRERVLSAVTADFKISDSLSATLVTGYNDATSKDYYDFDYQGTSYGAFMTSSVGLRNRPCSVLVTTSCGPNVYEYAISTGAPMSNFVGYGHGKSWDFSQEARLNWKSEKVEVMLGGYYFKSRSKSVSDQPYNPAMATMFRESLAAVRDRMTAACGTFYPACTQVVRRRSATSSAIIAYDAMTQTEISGAPGAGFPLWTTLTYAERRSQLENQAAFAFISYEPVERLKFTAEGRLAREKVTTLPGFDDSNAIDAAGNEVTAFSTFTTFERRSATFNSFTPRFSAHYGITETNNIYASVAKGTKPGGLNSVKAAAVGYGDFEEESVWSYEIGSKNQFMDNQVLLNLAAFSNTIKGYQLTESIVYADGVPSTVIKNVGKVRVRGLEIEAAFRPSAAPGLDMHVNYAYTKSKILKGRDANEGVLADVADDHLLNCSQGIDPSYEAVVAAIRANNGIPATTNICHNDTGTLYFGKFGDISGRSLPRQPKHLMNVGVDYHTGIGDDMTLAVGTNLTYESKKYVQVDNLAWYGEATIMSAYAALTVKDVTLRVWGKNLLNEDSAQAVSRFTDPANQNLRSFFVAPRMPRQFGVTATAKF